MERLPVGRVIGSPSLGSRSPMGRRSPIDHRVSRLWTDDLRPEWSGMKRARIYLRAAEEGSPSRRARTGERDERGQPRYCARPINSVTRSRSHLSRGGRCRDQEVTTTMPTVHSSSEASPPTITLAPADTPTVTQRKVQPTREDLEMIRRTRAARDPLSSKWKVRPALPARTRRPPLQPPVRQPPRSLEEDAHRLAPPARAARRARGAAGLCRGSRPGPGPFLDRARVVRNRALLIALAEWAESHLIEVEEARSRYDEASRPATIAPIGAHAQWAAA